jgi:Enoyl-(Acyl carrier protein) reductase
LVVSPGPTDTELFGEGKTEQDMQRFAQLAALGRLGQPQDIADVVALLVSDDARGITGQDLRVNGGIIRRRPARCSKRRAKSRNQAVSVASGRGPAASDRVTGRAVMALECALLLVEQMATVQGLDLSRRNARRVSRRYLSAWALAQGLHGLNSLVKIESEGPGRK